MPIARPEQTRRPQTQRASPRRPPSPDSDEDPTVPLLGSQTTADPPVQHARPSPRGRDNVTAGASPNANTNATASSSSWSRSARARATNTQSMTSRFGRSRMLLATCVALGIGLFTTLAVLFFHHGRPDFGNMCFLHPCISVADSMLTNGNFEADPCDDFYEYSCGNYENSKLIPDDKSRIGTFDDLALKNRELLIQELGRENDDLKKAKKREMSKRKNKKNIVTENSSEENPEIDALKTLVRNYYASCTNVEKIDALKAKPISTTLDTVFGSKCDFVHDLDNCAISVFPSLAMLGVDTVVNVEVTTDIFNPKKQVLAFSPGSLALPSKLSYKEQKLLDEYRNLIIKVLSVIPIEKPSKLAPPVDTPKQPTVNEIADMIVKLEAEIASIWPDPVDQNDPKKMFNSFKMSDAANLFDQFDLAKLATENMIKLGLKTDPASMEYVSVTWPAYLISLNHILQSPDNRLALGYHTRWMAIYSWIDQASTELRELLKDFRKAVYGVKAQPSRSEFCLRKTEQALGFGVGFIFVEKAFSQDARDQATQMTKNVLGEFKKKLDTVDWISDDVRQLAKQKIDKMTLKIGYPDFYSNSTYLLDYYSGVNSDVERFFENSLSAAQMSRRRELAQILKPTDTAKWGMYPQAVNAYHEPTKNEIVFPAGILQAPFFDIALPDAVNYGALGVVIGHELSHAFDNHGRNFDSDGKMTDWWDQQTADKYNAKAKRFESQYSEFSINGPGNKPLFVNGTLTLGENLGDNSGLKQSFAAFLVSLGSANKSSSPTGGRKQESRIASIPGFSSFSPKQLFFMSFANVWCNRMRTQYAQTLIRTNPHSPGNVRVLGTLQNSKEFAEAFSCAANKKMNPKDKNVLW